MPDSIFTAEQLAHIKAYAEPRYAAHAIQFAADLIFDALLLAVLVRPLYRLSERIAASAAPRLEWMTRLPVLRVVAKVPSMLWGAAGAGAALAFIGVTSVLEKVLELPYAIYIGYIHEKAFKLSNESFARFCWDHAKELLIGTTFLSLLVFGMFGLARRLKLWWLILGCVAAGAMYGSAALDPVRSMVYVKSHPLEAGPLRESITDVLHRANVEFGDIRVEQVSEKSVKPDAYFAGQGPTRTVVLYDTLISLMSQQELTAAVAHEAGHANEPRWKAWAGSSVALLLFMGLVELLMRLVARRGWWGVTERADVRALPLIMVVFALSTAAFGPLSKARERKAELDADRFALELTRDPETFKAMLIKLAKVSLSDPDPPRWHVVMNMSHPPFMERLAAVDAWQTAQTPRAGGP